MERMRPACCMRCPAACRPKMCSRLRASKGHASSSNGFPRDAENSTRDACAPSDRLHRSAAALMVRTRPACSMRCVPPHAAPLAPSVPPLASSVSPLASSVSPLASSVAPLASSVPPLASSVPPLASSGAWRGGIFDLFDRSGALAGASAGGCRALRGRLRRIFFRAGGMSVSDSGSMVNAFIQYESFLSLASPTKKYS